MPELPEVETIKRVIESQIQRLAIDRITVHHTDVIAHPTVDEFCQRLTGQRCSAMSRRGKYLIIHLCSGDRIVLHLRMTGCLLVTSKDDPIEKYTHLVFHLENGKELHFSDMRRFGRFWLLDNEEADTYSGIHKLGLEPFDPNFTAAYLSGKLAKRKKAIKQCLMEQSVIAGIGNIYSDEILFTAKIHPTRSANSLTASEWERLAVMIPERLSYFIQTNAITPEDYLRTKGKEYRNTPFLQVYGHDGQPCPCCGTTLCRTVIGGRSSVFCPQCQGNH
ncbi:MAG: DNA-formamidopyrimidine glycosylase [Clostridiales bacterium]|nr:DNA-formamidopyrimidine glycosylase [Clostridiales bacterium]